MLLAYIVVLMMHGLTSIKFVRIIVHSSFSANRPHVFLIMYYFDFGGVDIDMELV